jgi:hypothetical protein
VGYPIKPPSMDRVKTIDATASSVIEFLLLSIEIKIVVESTALP